MCRFVGVMISAKCTEGLVRSKMPTLDGASNNFFILVEMFCMLGSLL